MKTKMLEVAARIIFIAVFLLSALALSPAPAKAATDTLKIWSDEDGLWWVENKYYKIELTNASSFTLKMGVGSREWRQSPQGTLGQYWIGAAANDTDGNAYGFWRWYGSQAEIDSINVNRLDVNTAIVTIISHGILSDKRVSVENTMTFKADKPEIKVTSRLLSSDSRFPIQAFIYKFFLTPGGDDTSGDMYYWSGGGLNSFPPSVAEKILKDEFTPITADYIYLSIFDFDARQGMAIVTQRGKTHDVSLAGWEGRAIIEGNRQGIEPNMGIYMDASVRTTFYLLPFEIVDGNYVKPIHDFVKLLSPTITYRTFKSEGNLDGWVLESSQASQRGGSFNVKDPVFRLGDDASNRQYKSILSFDTSDLPDDALIASAVVRFKQYRQSVGSNPFNILGNLRLDIRKGTFETEALAANDFEAPATATRVGIVSKNAVDNWYTSMLNDQGKKFIHKTDKTQFRLYFYKSSNNDLSSDYLRFYSGNASSANQPTLTIGYYTP